MVSFSAGLGLHRSVFSRQQRVNPALDVGMYREKAHRIDICHHAMFEETTCSLPSFE